MKSDDGKAIFRCQELLPQRTKTFVTKTPLKLSGKLFIIYFTTLYKKKKIRQIYVSWKENYIELTYCNNYFWSYHLKL